VELNPGHGTSTASVIMSAVGSQAAPEFVTGAAPRVQLVPLRVSTSVIHLSYAKLTKALYYAADHGHHVVSMSLGGPFKSDFLLRAIRHAMGRGVILLGAAGNIWPWVVYPARYDEVIAVAACNCAREIWAWSSEGAAVDVTAAGESVWCAFTGDGQDPFRVGQSSGTSYAVRRLRALACLPWP
jgi:serine protease